MSTTSSFTLLLHFLILPLLVASQSPSGQTDPEDDEEEFYVLDIPSSFQATLRTKSPFLLKVIRTGTRCESGPNHINNGVSANNGTSILNSCKKHCRNTLRDENCGMCGNKCQFGQNCCGRVCMNVAYNPYHCGKCTRQCPPGVPCSYGSCGYA